MDIGDTLTLHAMHDDSSHSSSSRCVKMRHLSTGKSIAVISIVIGCFAILWPRMLYPMLLTALRLHTSPNVHDRHSRGRGAIVSNFVHPRAREAMETAAARANGNFDAVRSAIPLEAAKINVPNEVEANERGPSIDAGFMGLVVPIYSILIIVFLVYTMFRLITKQSEPCEDDKVKVNEIVGEEQMKHSDVDDWSKVEHLTRTSFAYVEEDAEVNFDEDDEVSSMRFQLEERGRVMAKLLSSIEELGDQLARAGVLPHIPGLSLSSSLRCEASRNLYSERQTCFNQRSRLYQGKLTSAFVSDALQLLICKMEVFKKYLVETEELRERLSRHMSDLADERRHQQSNAHQSDDECCDHSPPPEREQNTCSSHDGREEETGEEATAVSDCNEEAKNTHDCKDSSVKEDEAIVHDLIDQELPKYANKITSSTELTVRRRQKDRRRRRRQKQLK